MKSKKLPSQRKSNSALWLKLLVWAVCTAGVVPRAGTAGIALRADAAGVALRADTAQVTPAAVSLPSLGDTERELFSPQLERKLGEQIMRDIRRNRDYLDDAPLQEYLNNFGAQLLAARPEAVSEAGFDFTFFAVRDPVLNAFALPGGFIGMYSGLLLAAQTESELASVMAHEIGHVSQRHLARMLGQQRQDRLIPLAALVLAALASRGGADASMAVLAGGQGLSLQRQLDFSREAEREADRIGFQTLSDAGFETAGMVAFFGRLQVASRSYTDAAPSYLRTHPLTTERIADIQSRIRSQRYRQRADRLDFYLMQARARVVQDSSAQGLREAARVFTSQLTSQLAQKPLLPGVAARYGLALVAHLQGQPAKALEWLQQARTEAKNSQATLATPFFYNLAIAVRLAASQPGEALSEAEAARRQFPLSRGVAYQYAQSLHAAGRYADATQFLRDQTQLYRQEPQLYDLLAKTYAAQGKQALQHLALAESYGMSGSLPEALGQLTYARRAPDVSFYDQSVIDAREREFKALRQEELKESKNK